MKVIPSLELEMDRPAADEDEIFTAVGITRLQVKELLPLGFEFLAGVDSFMDTVCMHLEGEIDLMTTGIMEDAVANAYQEFIEEEEED